MDDFIEAFDTFRDWLYERVENSESYENEAFVEVIEKFESLGLNTAL